jgi:hypothetical protein
MRGGKEVRGSSFVKYLESTVSRMGFTAQVNEFIFRNWVTMKGLFV